MKTLFFDTETTGLLKPCYADFGLQPKVIELCAVVEDEDGSESGVFDEVLNPGFPVSPEITRITGLTNDVVGRGRKYDDAVDEIRGLFATADAVVGHNLMFDKMVLDYQHAVLGRGGIKWPPVERLFCTVELTEHFFGRRIRLTDLFMQLCPETPFPGAHRASNDVAMLRGCWHELKRQGELPS